ncbi:MAG: ATP-grasp domain-containing protein [Clostridiaceae bacterium]
MNILFTSVGRRSYLIKYFKEALGSEGEIHAANNTALTPAFEFADKTVVTPMIYDKVYIRFLKEYCVKNHIDAIISLFDVDLPVLAAHRDVFEGIGVKLIVSDVNVVSMCNDKWAAYVFYKQNGFNTPRTYLSREAAINAWEKGEIKFPLYVKPRWGMGSIGLFEADNLTELGVMYEKTEKAIDESYLKYESLQDMENSIIIQEKLTGQEYGLDVICDLNCEYKTTIVKKKYAMRSGETDCAVTVDLPVLKELGEALGRKLKHIGNLDADIFMVGDIPYILELNPRFGGGYPFSHIAGVNLPMAIIKWLRGEEADDSLLTARIGVLAHKDIEVVRLDKYKES